MLNRLSGTWIKGFQIGHPQGFIPLLCEAIVNYS